MGDTKLKNRRRGGQTVDRHNLSATREIGMKPRKTDVRNAKGVVQTREKNGMINSINDLNWGLQTPTLNLYRFLIYDN